MPVSRSDSRATLVVSIVLDQMGSWVLEHHLGLLDADGLIRTMLARGTWARDLRLSYAITYTAPGHAAVYSGAPPADSGISANRVWDRAQGRMRSVVDDGVHHEFGGPGGESHAFAAPTMLRVDTVADVLRREGAHRPGETVIVALSMKDRSAVIPGGQRPDLSLWYTEDARGFTTSTYYSPRMPEWVTRWNASHPVSDYFSRAWSPLDAAALRATGMTDDQPGEGNWRGLGVTFPHVLSQSTAPYSAFLATPFSTEFLVDMAREMVDRFHLGADSATDLLMLSVSGTDYVGHVFGPESWESMDNLVRVDRRLGAFVRELSQHREVAVLVTADHGATPLVERAPEGSGAARITFDGVERAAEAALDRALGEGDWVAAYVQPYVFLRPAALTPALRERAIGAALEGVATVAGVGQVVRVSDAVGWRNDPDPVRRALGESVDQRSAGELFVVPSEGSVVDERMPSGHGSGHGSPYRHDQSIPLLVMGPGVPHRELTQPGDFRSVAATLAHLVGVTPPRAARREAIWQEP